MSTYVFNIKYKPEPNVWREIEMLGHHTLDDLHNIIYNIFGFPEEKLYSFFMSGEAWDSESEYCSPLVDGDNADVIKIQELELQTGNKFLYMFDYGSAHEFEVELLEIGDQDEDENEYPRLLAEEGTIDPELMEEFSNESETHLDEEE